MCAVGVVARNLLNFVSSRCTEFQRKSTLGVHGVYALNLVCSRCTEIYWILFAVGVFAVLNILFTQTNRDQFIVHPDKQQESL